MKSCRRRGSLRHFLSLPVRGAWVEIARKSRIPHRRLSRSPCGERGLKYAMLALLPLLLSVAPRAGSVG